MCHYCGHAVRSDIVCPNCRSSDLVGLGFGTERIEEELIGLFPGARIARLDRDVSRGKSYIETLRKVREHEIDILVGTQMIAKGHHFPNVTLVGVVWADAGLGLPDFKAGERTFQLLSQVTGRAGRGEKPGRVIIQTHQPGHYSIVAARDHDYQSFFDKEAGLRSTLGYPPFTRLVNLRFEGSNENAVREAASEVADEVLKLINNQRHLSVLGPAPSPLSKIRGKFRWQLLLKSRSIEMLHSVVTKIEESLPPQVRTGGVKLAVDVDPETML